MNKVTEHYKLQGGPFNGDVVPLPKGTTATILIKEGDFEGKYLALFHDSPYLLIWVRKQELHYASHTNKN